MDPGTVRFAFRPLWQLSASEKAAVALQKAQKTAVYAGLSLWPVEKTAALLRSQLLEDQTYPGAGAAFGATPKRSGPEQAQAQVADDYETQLRDPQGRWTSGGGSRATSAGTAAPPRPPPTVVAAHIHEDPSNEEAPEDEQEKQLQEQLKELDDPIRGGPRTRPDGTLSVPTPMPAPALPAAAAPLRQREPFERTPEQNAGLNQLFGKRAAGAELLLDQIATGEVKLPSSVDRELLEKYAVKAQEAIDRGIDNGGVQALRLKAVRKILGKDP